MLVNLVPEFLDVLASPDRVAAYHAYFERHRPLLSAYWENYVVDPQGPLFDEVVRAVVDAPRDDLHSMLARVDVASMATRVATRVQALLDADVDSDVVLMVGVGAANAGELVVNGRGLAFACLEHFTGVQNPDTQGLGLDPELLPLWIAHELAHVVRYTSPTSRSEMRRLVDEAGGHYSYWETGRLATLRELVCNEGIAVQLSRAISPGHAEWEYYGFARRQFARIRELEPQLTRAISADFDRAGLGLRLRYLSGGMSDDARTVERITFPERAGYFLGARLVEPGIRANGLAWAVRAAARELTAGLGDVAPPLRLIVGG